MATTIRIDGLAESTVEIRELPPTVARQTILGMSQLAYDGMQAGAGRHNKTGALFQSVYNRALAPLQRQVGHDAQRAPHAVFLLHGSRPHKIAPKDKKALRWVSGNGFVFARTVNHPGYRGDNYLEDAADAAIRGMAELVDRAMKGT